MRARFGSCRTLLWMSWLIVATACVSYGTLPADGGGDGVDAGASVDAPPSGDAPPGPGPDASGPEGCALASWAYAAPVAIANEGGELTDYPVKLSIDTAALIAAGALQGGCEDLRFVDSGGELPYWIESGCDTAATVVWVRLPVVPTRTSELHVQYGNPTAATASDGSAAFPAFDDFTTGDLAAWTTGAVALQDGHDVGVSTTADAVTFTSPPYSAAFYGYASCGSAPFDGVGAFAEMALALPAADYCVDGDTRTDILGFDYTTTAIVSVSVSIAGTEVYAGQTTCSGAGCTTSSGWQSLHVAHTGAVSSLRLRATSADCTESRTWFDNVRVRPCATPEPTASLGAERSCN